MRGSQWVDAWVLIEHIYMKVWHSERKEAVRFLQIVTDSKRTPVLVHCQYGADRTGAMCALNRIAVQNWTKEEAIGEMTQGGFGFHKVWKNLSKWIQEIGSQSMPNHRSSFTDFPEQLFT